VEKRDGKPYCTLALPLSATVGDLKQAFHKQKKHFGPERQRFEVKKEPKNEVMKNDEDLLSKYFPAGQVAVTVVFKDLGFQIGWKTVFYAEYFGPLFIHPLLYYFPEVFYPGVPNEKPKHLIQTVALVCVLVHYLKRELETMFVHHFSNGTMPWTNIIKNCSHYWGISGVAIGYFLYHPLYTPASWLVAQPELFYGLVGLMAFAELNNLHCHIVLMNLRPAGTKVRKIPHGNVFGLVACANYFWESLAWLAFAIFTQTVTSYLFFLFSAGQMLVWAIKKHKQYKEEFGEEYKKLRRRVMVPFVI